MPAPRQKRATQEKGDRVTWPLFHCLSVEAQAALMQYQWDNYGYYLEIPPLPDDTHVATTIESPEEIGKIIRWAKSRSRGKSG